MSARGFTLIELLVATLIVLAIAGALAAFTTPLRATFDRTLAAGDITVRSRASVARLVAELSEAGSVSGGVSGTMIADIFPVVVPMASLEDARLVEPFRAVRLTTVADDGGQGVLRSAVMAGGSSLEMEAPARCAQSRGVCGFVDENRAVLFDAARAEPVIIRTIDPAQTALLVNVPVTRAFAVGAAVVAIEEVSYGLRADADGSMRLVRISDGGAEQPVVDHVVEFEIVLTGASAPPEPRTNPAAPPTYGPTPPLLGEDDDRDAWGAGENCTMRLDDEGERQPRLQLLGHAAALTALSGATLSDGPWCPDEAVPIFDADLLRVRRIDLLLRVEAAAAHFRGPTALLFRRPGAARRSAEWVPDVEARISIPLRSR